MPSPIPAGSEGPAIVGAIAELDLSSPTACENWTARHVAAHLAAGAKEIADLIEESLAGRRERPTRGFEAREAPFRDLPDDELRNRMLEESLRKLAGYDALRQRTENPAINFTGTRITVDELTDHSRSEAAIHHWDLVGDNEVSDALLAQPDLTAHAVKVLNRMPTLNESARALGSRAASAVGEPIRIVFRSPDQADVVFVESNAGGQFELTEPAGDDAVIVTTSAANRLLVLWGRRSSNHPITTAGDPTILGALPQVAWPNAQPWPR